METGAADLEAVIEAARRAGGDRRRWPTRVNRAVRVCAERPDLVEAMVVPGGSPPGAAALEGTEAMASSDSVVDAFLSMCETDYRGALRSLVTAGNPQMSEEEIRERVRLQAEYQPQEAAVARLRAWVDDDAAGAGTRLRRPALAAVLRDHGRAAGSRRARKAVKLSRKLFPEAHVEGIENGIVSRPDLTAAVVRRIRSKPPSARA